MTDPNSTRYPRNNKVEAAKLLVSVARRFAEDRATVQEVEEAIQVWREEIRLDQKG